MNYKKSCEMCSRKTKYWIVVVLLSMTMLSAGIYLAVYFARISSDQMSGIIYQVVGFQGILRLSNGQVYTCETVQCSEFGPDDKQLSMCVALADHAEYRPGQRAHFNKFSGQICNTSDPTQEPKSILAILFSLLLITLAVTTIGIGRAIYEGKCCYECRDDKQPAEIREILHVENGETNSVSYQQEHTEREEGQQ